MTQDLKPIYLKYNKKLKPLISEIEGRLELFEEPLLTNLMAQFDYVALYMDKKDQNLLKQADYFLDLSISNSFQYLIYALSYKIKVFKKRYGGKKTVEDLSNGEVAGCFKDLERKAQDAVRKGIRLNDNEALPYYKDAYNTYLELEKIVEQLPLSSLRKKQWGLGLSLLSWILSIIISVIVGILVSSFF